MLISSGSEPLSRWLNFSWHDLEFAIMQARGYGFSENPLRSYIPYGMPRINDQFLDSVFYLYPSREAASRGDHMGGTGVLVSVNSKSDPSKVYAYGVTNRHVAVDCGHSVIRINKQDGDIGFGDFDPAEWTVHPDGDDLAVIPLFGLESGTHHFRLVNEGTFITPGLVEELDIGPGDEVFMVGRFVHHDGRERNHPSVRFGNISMNPRPILQDRPGGSFSQESYAVEMRSMAGYSGSPVFVYRGPWDLRSGNINMGSGFLYLLGINWGHVVDDWSVDEKVVPVSSQAKAPTKKESYVRANTGMNGVVPAWKVKEMLLLPKFQEIREKADQELLARLSKQRGGIELDASGPGQSTTDENPRHREDFNSLLGAVARGKKPDEET